MDWAISSGGESQSAEMELAKRGGEWWGVVALGCIWVFGVTN